jgi:hypothetical protein
MQVSRTVKPVLPAQAKPAIASLPEGAAPEVATTSQPGASHGSKPDKSAELPEWKAARNAWQDGRSEMTSAEWLSARTAWMEQRDVALGKIVAPEPEISEPPVVEETEGLEPPVVADGDEPAPLDSPDFPIPDISQPIDAMPELIDLLAEAEPQELPGEGEI